LWLAGGSLPFFLHIRWKLLLKKGQEEERKSASSRVGVAALVVVSRLNLHTNVGDGDIGRGYGSLALALALAPDDDDEEILFPVRENLGLLLLLLLLLHTLNLELLVGFDGGDDSFEDPDSGPCAFPLPAFNGAPHFFLVVFLCCFALPFLPTSLLLLVQLPPL
jgi:hypothetical protein